MPINGLENLIALLNSGIEISEMYNNGIFFITIKQQNSNLMDCLQIVQNCINRGFLPQLIVIVVENLDNYQNKTEVFQDILKQFNISAQIITFDQYKTIILDVYKNIPKHLIAVTGSSGKTTVCNILYNFIKKHMKQKVFLSSSAGIGSDIIVANQLSSIPFADMWFMLNKNNHCTNAIIEATSHSLKQQRIYGLQIDIGVFVSLQDNHLDYHKTKDDYIKTKLKLIDYIKPNGIFIISKEIFSNIDFSEEHLEILQSSIAKKNIHMFIVEINGEISSSYNEYEKINISLCLEIFKNMQYLVKLEEINQINWRDFFPLGRFQKIGEKDKSIVITDGAHSPDQIRSVVKLYQSLYKEKNILILYGIAGHRVEGDAHNAAIIDDLLRKDDLFFIVDDNPKNIDSEIIIENLYKECKKTTQIYKYHNRFTAMTEALKYQNTCVLVLGKSTEVSNIIEFKYTITKWLKFFDKTPSYLNFINNVEIITQDSELLLNIYDILVEKYKFTAINSKYFININNTYDVKLKIFIDTQNISYVIFYNEINLLTTMMQS